MVYLQFPAFPVFDGSNVYIFNHTDIIIFSRNPGPQKRLKTRYVMVVCHVAVVAIGHGLLQKFWPMVIGCVLRTAGSSID